MNDSESMASVVVASGRRRLITGTVMLASILQALDTTIANVALPRMQGTMAASQDQMTWVLTSYIVAAAIMTPLTGWLVDQFGRKRLFLVSIIGFTITSAMCGMADTLGQIVAFRLLQGLCGAALVPISQAILFDIYPRNQHARAMSIWGVGVTMGPMIGPVLGGYLTDHLSWRWVFYINVPFGLLAALGVMIIFRRRDRQRRPFDFFGFATLSAAVGALQLLLDRGSQQDWFNSSEIQIEATVVVFAVFLFLVHSLTTRSPFIRVALFKDRNFVGGLVFIVLLGAVMFGSMALLPSMLQNLMGYSVLDAGLATFPRSIGNVLSMAGITVLMRGLGARTLIGLGFGLTAVSLWEMSHFSITMGMSMIVWTGVLQGIGLGMTFIPATTFAFATVPAIWRDEATAVFSLARNIGASAGISLVQALLVRNTQVQHAVLAGHLTAYQFDQLHRSLGHWPYRSLTLPALNAEITTQASMVAYIDDYRLMFYLVLLVMPLVLLLRAPASRQLS